MLGAERRPLGADRALVVPVRGHFQAAVGRARRVDADQYRDLIAGIGVPAGLHVLVCLEAIAAGQLEIDLVLEQHRRLFQELRHRRERGPG